MSTPAPDSSRTGQPTPELAGLRPPASVAPGSGLDIGYLVVLASQLVHDATEHGASEVGMPANDLNALYMLNVHGPLTAGYLAELMFLQPASITPVIDRLHTAGHITKRRDPDDKRRVWLTITPTGHDTLQQAGTAIYPRILDVFAPLPHGAVTALCALLDDVVQPWLHTHLPSR